MTAEKKEDGQRVQRTEASAQKKGVNTGVKRSAEKVSDEKPERKEANPIQKNLMPQVKRGDATRKKLAFYRENEATYLRKS